MPTPDFNFLIYKTAEEDITVNAVIRDETIWLTQKAMSELFGVQAPAISKHLNNIYEEGELLASSTISKMEIVQEEGSRAVKRLVDFYNLDAIISVGYRINSRRATQFRIWATGVLKEYMVKGFAMDDDRLKQGKTAFGKDYFRELLERVRSIRASERRIWQQVTDIYAECSIDYDRNAPTTQQFYAMVQNRFHYAITHKTAAEIVHDSADHTKEHMGLTTWAKAPNGKIIRSDVSVAKNYLKQNELQALGRLVNAYLDMAKDMAERHIPMTMEDWAKRIDKFLDATNRDILQGAGSITAEYAKQYAESEFEKYRVIQDRLFRSDFDLLNENQTTIPYEEL